MGATAPIPARPWTDALTFSSAWLALAAGALVAASSGAMGIEVSGLAVGLATCGTLVVYNVDRLRDLDRDRLTSPERSEFVTRHRGALTNLAVAAALASAVLGVLAGMRAALALLPVFGVGLLHRRLKRFDAAKAAYITLAWLVVVVGMPYVLASPQTEPAVRVLGWVAAILGAAIGANAIASNVRDAEAAAARYGEALAMRAARALALLGAALCALGPGGVGALAPIPVLTWVALLGFQRTERYGLLVIDGALLTGALLACALS